MTSPVTSPVDFSWARGVRVADVFKAGRKAARLERTPSGVRFSYYPDYLSHGVAVATTLALDDQAVVTPSGAVPPFFAGLLPEGHRLSGLRRATKTSADDELTLLIAVGRDPVGDVQIVPEGEHPTSVEPMIVVDSSMSEVRFSDLLRAANIVDPVALPGMQEKASVGVISLPLSAKGSKYILKIDPPEYPHLAQNEAYFLEIARTSGMAVVDAQLVRDAVGQYGLLVRRFDRGVTGDGLAKSFAVEDASQLLGLWPADKYNVTSEQVVAGIARVCPAGVVAAQHVFRQLCFALLTGNGDVHAKNISVLRSPDGEWMVAPAYDLPSTIFYDDLTLALAIHGKTSNLSRDTLLSFATEIALPEKAASRIINDMLDATSEVEPDLRDGRLPFDEHTISQALRRLKYRRALVAG